MLELLQVLVPLISLKQEIEGNVIAAEWIVASDESITEIQFYPFRLHTVHFDKIIPTFRY